MPSETPKSKKEKKSFWEILFLPNEKKLKHTNRYMFLVCLFMVLLFFSMIGYMIRFQLVDSQAIITNPYNQRTENLKKQIIRGDILSADGDVLAKTEIDEEGNETRVYPYDEIFAHVVGFSTHGKGGLESAYNYELLTSHTDIMTQLGNGISSKKNPGDDLVTTLDPTLQERAYEALDDYQGAIVAIEPSTGKIRAMVSKPVFNPNDLEEIWADIVNDDSSSVLLNRCTQGLYPPGSTYKVITALEYILEHAQSYEDFRYTCEGKTVVDSVKIKCYEDTEHGKENLTEAFENSCNTAFVTIGSALDRKKYISLNDAFLFNQKIPGDLSVAKSRFDITMKSDKSSLPQTVIGQGNTLMSPLHNALVMCMIANDGVMMKPMLVDKIQSKDGVTVKRFDPKSIARLEEEDIDSVKAVQQMLRKVVTDGTGHALQDDDYTVAGKTGSAENEKEGAHSWFAGYSNVEDPDLVVCVIAENAGAGSKVAAPIAKEIFDAYYEEGLDKKY